MYFYQASLRFAFLLAFAILICTVVSGVSLVAVAADNLGGAGSASDTVQLSYNQTVRPVLSNHCFACHGPDEEAREADLRLDLAGEVDSDVLAMVLERTHSNDPDVIMPPPKLNKPLDDEKRAVLARWIDEGGIYQQHWAFKLPEKPAVPKSDHPVDYFVDRKLMAQQQNRSPQAAPYLLLRRVHLALTGVPPTISAADAFAANPSNEAYEAVVDKLLASPRYGERWARRWLDLARYADTNGYEKDRDRSIWPYRDWVIRAINKDKPFNEFTIEQLAGDMLPSNGDPAIAIDRLIATGFHRNTMLNEEGGIDPLEFRYHAMTDRVATTGTTWLGLTTGCAQCHSHKYDPITHRDYFGMMAFMDNTDEPTLLIPGAESEKNSAQRAQSLKEIVDQLAENWPKDADEQPSLEDALAAWIKTQRAHVPRWKTLVPAGLDANVPYLVLESDGVVYAGGDSSKHDIYTLTFEALESPVTAIRLEAMPDARLPGNGPGMTYYEGTLGDFYLTEFEVLDEGDEPIGLSSSTQSYSDNSFLKDDQKPAEEPALMIDHDIQTGWSIGGRSGVAHEAVVNLHKAIPAGTSFTIRMHFGRHFSSSLGKFRCSVASVGNQWRATSITPEIRKALNADDAHENSDVRVAFLLQAKQLKEQANEYYELRNKPLGDESLVMRERPAEHGRPTFLRHRGEYTQPKGRVLPRIPEVLVAPGAALPSNRLEFARWLVSRNNPLTARVVANRQWAAFFGTGIVSTLDDFGMQGQPPSHPELLDFLAVELMDGGWSIKKLHRLIVTSATYKQASSLESGGGVSNHEPRSLPRYARFARTRLEAELIRDASLFAAGLLHEKMYGPPVRPLQPAAAVGADFKQSRWEASEGTDRYRRSIYTYQKRTAPFAMFTTFDATTGESCVAKRDVSNTPLQALTLMNDPMFIEMAEAFGSRMAAVDGNSREKITSGFRWILTRPPAAHELTLLSDFHNKHKDWTALGRVILCLDEAITNN